MSLFRSPMLIPGFYWYDAPADKSPGFNAWLTQNRALVKVRKSTVFSDSGIFASNPNAHTWALFEVIFPVLWLDAAQFGFPNTASKETDPDVISSGAEPEKDAIDKIADGAKEILPFLAPVSSGILVMGGLVGLGYIFRKEIFDYGLRKYRSSGNRRRKSA